MSHRYVQYESLNRYVFRRLLNAVTVSDDRMSTGRPFHASGPATANAPLPNLTRVLGTRRSPSGAISVLIMVAQKLISSSMSRHLSTRNISPKSMHAFLSNLANRQTDRQTNERRQTHLPPPLSEVISRFLIQSPADFYDTRRND